jgi:hypothetical protein
MFKTTFLAVLLLFSITSIGNTADFYLAFENCRTTVGYLVLSDQSLRSVEGAGSFMGCTRMSNSIRCETEFIDGINGHKWNLAEYKVDLDSPPLLIFTDGKMADYFVIDLTQHAATIISRVVDKTFAGAKVCRGMYMTESEFRGLEKQKNWWSMAELFDAFYSKMILRDFFGKIVPWLIVLSTVAVCIWWEEISLSDLTKILGSVSVLGWLTVFGAAWITGISIQCFGESFPPRCPKKRLLGYFPAEIPNSKAFFESWVNFRDIASPQVLVDAERFVVIKEVCGNASVSLAISLSFVIVYILLHYLHYRMVAREWRTIIPILFLWISLIHYLRKMHLIHVKPYPYLTLPLVPGLTMIQWLASFALTLAGPAVVRAHRMCWDLPSRPDRLIQVLMWLTTPFAGCRVLPVLNDPALWQSMQDLNW